MSIEQGGPFLTEFEFEGQRRAVIFREHVIEFPGVESDTYDFVDDQTSDLAIIRIDPGIMTPRQRVVEGERTVEIYVSGKGRLIVERTGGEVENHDFGVETSKHPLVDVLKGDIMQLRAAPDSDFSVAEICFPPYKIGRFEDLS